MKKAAINSVRRMLGESLMVENSVNGFGYSDDFHKFLIGYIQENNLTETEFKDKLIEVVKEELKKKINYLNYFHIEELDFASVIILHGFGNDEDGNSFSFHIDLYPKDLKVKTSSFDYDKPERVV